MAGFQFNTVADIRVGAGAAQQLGALCQQLGIAKPLIVTDPGLVQIGLLDPVREGVARVYDQVSVFSAVTADPSESVVEAALQRLENRICRRRDWSGRRQLNGRGQGHCGSSHWAAVAARSLRR